MFENTFKIEHQADQYKLQLRHDEGFSKAKDRILIVLQMVPSVGLKEKDILPRGMYRTTLINVIKQAKKRSRVLGKPIEDAKFCVVNFNCRKHLDLSDKGKLEAESEFRDRLRLIIKKVKPTKIFFSGDAPASIVNTKDIKYKKGWILKYKDIPAVVSYDFDSMLANYCEAANLLGQFWTHLSYLLLGKHPFSLKHKTHKYKYIDSKEKFKVVYKKLLKSKEIAIDTETRNLSVLSNEIFTIQFAFIENPDVGYVVVLRHPKANWIKEDLEYVESKLKDFFLQDKGPLLDFFNGAFDLRVIRRQLRIPVIKHRVWDIQAGEHLLDENLSLDNDPPQGNLLATICRYENGFYLKAKFSKGDRYNIGSMDPDNEDVLKYASMDACCLLWIRQMQLKYASTLKIGERNYRSIYENHVENIMGEQVHQMSHLMEEGSKVDGQYLRSLLREDSPFNKALKNIENEISQYEAVKETNDIVLKDSGFKSKGLFKKVKQWGFKVSKPAHRAILFLKVMGLKHVSETKTGAPAIDKRFIAEYKDKYPEVADYEQYVKAKKVESTYIKGWLKILNTNSDAIKDSCIRAAYGFFGVVTGRLAAKKPGFQQIPSRGDLAKAIERAFIPEKGRLPFKFDFSAHEVRFWANVSKDTNLANAFKAGQSLRIQWIQTPTSEIKEKLKKKGDVHIQNVYRFFRKWVEKSDPLRYAIKAVIFGVIYGLSTKSLARDIGPGALAAKALKKETDKEKRKELKLTIKESDDLEYAKGIVKKTFEEFPKGNKWLKKTSKLAEEEGYVYSPLGRRRNLPAIYTGEKGVIAKQIRRGVNAPIQGSSSEIGSKSSRLIMLSYDKCQNKLLKRLTKTKVNLFKTRLKFIRVVHDASYFSTVYAMFIPTVHIAQYEATYGITKAIKDEFNFEFLVEPEIEIEFGATEDNHRVWDWSLPDLIECIKFTIEEADKLGFLSGSKDSVLEEVMRPYRDKRVRDFLQKNYPLLGVRNLDKQIEDALKLAHF